jgi:hypothetical protein
MSDVIYVDEIETFVFDEVEEGKSLNFNKV